MADQPWTVPPLNDLMDVDTRWGRMPLWKCRAMSLAYTQTAIADAADTKDDQPLTTRADPKEEPPPLAADASINTNEFANTNVPNPAAEAAERKAFSIAQKLRLSFAQVPTPDAA